MFRTNAVEVKAQNCGTEASPNKQLAENDHLKFAQILSGNTYLASYCHVLVFK